ncbi:DUF202 domain-containing protein [Paenibacillus sp. N4]|uniref:YidH family protein n=1 Tax=Paenibacillus vietnamensis TaxID=2590547 RepID=UPI001CD15E1F|nr:DUF202 domain-containing protein [Paenibacillus vietnamensis]MCA0758472.1 DUF202 domain-containing protein [Paenibacillus vietnamensis]
MKEQADHESKYIQQHLANERTYLAWVRTSITIMGLGFLAAGIVFQFSANGAVGHMLAVIAGIGSAVLGFIIMGLATREYMIKRRGINTETFRSTGMLVKMLFVALALIEVLLIALVVYMFFWL